VLAVLNRCWWIYLKKQALFVNLIKILWSKSNVK